LVKSVGNTGTIPIAAVKSSGVMKFTGDGTATTVPAGKRFSVDGTEKVFTNLAPVSVPAVAPFEALGDVEAEEFGPVVATTSDTFTIITPVSNLVSVEMDSDALLGRFNETDAELRTRQQTTTQSRGGGTVEAIRDRLLEVTGTTYAAVIPNDTDSFVNVEGLSGNQPPHSVLPVVEGGADQDIFDAVWQQTGGGIETHGTEVGSSVDSLGISREVKFNRTVLSAVKAEVTFSKVSSEYPGDPALTNAVVAYVSSLSINDDVILHKLEANIATTIGGLVSLSIRIAKLADPFGTANIVIGPVGRASLAPIDVTLIEV
jgi:hypothetical protein